MHLLSNQRSPLPQGWARREVGNGSRCFTNFSKRPKYENLDVLTSTKIQEPGRPYRRRRRVDDAFDTILRHASFGDKSTCAGEFSQTDRPYRPWRSTRSLSNANSSTNTPENSRTGFSQYADEFTEQNSKCIYDEEGESSQVYKRSPSLFDFKGCQHAPFQRWEPNADFRCDRRTHPAYFLPTYPSENETRLSNSLWIHADSYTNGTQYLTSVFPDSNPTDRRHFQCLSQSFNGKENNLFYEEDMNAARIQSCRSPMENTFCRMQSVPEADYRNCPRTRHFPLAPHCCGDAEALSVKTKSKSPEERQEQWLTNISPNLCVPHTQPDPYNPQRVLTKSAMSSQPKPMFSQTLPPNYLLSDDQGHENHLSQSSQSCRRLSGCPLTNYARDKNRKINPVHGNKLASIHEAECDCQSDLPVSTESLLEVFTEDWVLPLAQNHSTPKREPLQPYIREKSTSNSALSTSNCQPTKELQRECWEDSQSACSRRTPIPGLDKNNDKAIQVSFGKSTSNVEVQASFSTSLTTTCPRCGYMSSNKGASQTQLCSRLPTAKLNSSLKTPRTVPPLEPTTNLINDTVSSTSTCTSVDLPLPANLSSERTPKQCILQEGGAPHSVYGVYSISHPLLQHRSVSNQYAASAKVNGRDKLADITSPPYDFGVED